MKEQSPVPAPQKTGPAAANAGQGGISRLPPPVLPLQETPLEETGMITTMAGPAIQRFTLPLQRTAPPSQTIIQRVGGLGNSANDCFLNAVIQLLEKSYADLFNPAINILRPDRQPIQQAMWKVITDLRADKTVPAETVNALRKDLNGKGLVADCHSQEDAQELMVKIIDYVIGGSSNNYPYENGHLLLQHVETYSQDKDVVKDVPEKEHSKEPSALRESSMEIGSGLIGIDINIYHSFEDFLYYLYGSGTTTQLAVGEHLKVQKDGKQVYVNARTEKRSFPQLPAVLTFYVKRFVGNTKNSRAFPMPETVILVEASLDGKKQYKTYTLEASVRHTGVNDTLSGGHYYAIKKNEKQEWTRYNDTRQETPDKNDQDQGSLYSYRMTAAKDALDTGEVTYQETQPKDSRPPNTKGVSLPPLPGNAGPGGKPPGGTSPIKGGGFSPFLGLPPIASDKIRGLPNRARDTPGGQKRVLDCFINAVLQLIAGPYRDLFDPGKHTLTNPVSKEIQAAVHILIRKVNNEDTNPVAEDDITKLRNLLYKRGGVPSLYEQEDGAELMQFLLGLMLDITGTELDLPGTDASVTSKENNPGKLATDQNVKLEDLVRHNKVLKEHLITADRQERIHKADIADDSQPDIFEKNTTRSTLWQAEPEPLGNMIVIDIGQIADFEEFLFQRYGKEWEKETFTPENYVKYPLTTGKEKKDTPFKARDKHYRFTNLPPTLTFLVKRFTQDDNGRKKDARDYALPGQLILVEEPGGGKKMYKHYELKAIVVHTGKTLEEGHYYTHRKEGKDWIKANDQSIWQEGSPGADLKQGYMYTYHLTGQSEQLSAGQQAPQEKYNLPATIFKADGKLRPTDAIGFAADPKHRNTQAQNAVSGAINQLIKRFFPDQEGVFHAGHLFTSTLGGAGDARNLTPMWGSYNTGAYKTFEDEDLTGLLDEVKTNQQLYIHIQAAYPEDDTPEQVFHGLLNPQDIQRLVNFYKSGDGFFKKKIAEAKSEDDAYKYEKLWETAKGVKNYYEQFIRVCRRIPLRMSDPEVRIITFDAKGNYLRRSENRSFSINGSPRAMLGKLNFDAFLDNSTDELQADAPAVRLYGNKQSIDLKGQDPDEWAVKTYSAMPEPGVYQYYNDGGRASGVDAYIWMDPEGIFSTYKFGGGTEDAGPAPAGFDWRLLNQAARNGSRKIYVRGHLLNGKLHGSGNDPQNLTPLTQDANKAMSRDFEEKIKQAPALVTPGRGIFWMTRLTGKVARSDTFNSRLAERKKRLGSEPGDRLELQVALAEEEAKMFSGIHVFAYEAIVQPNGSLKKGPLIHSAYFANKFSEDGDNLGDTSYASLFGSDKKLALLELGYRSEREALQYLSDAIDAEHANANETYKKDPPAMDAAPPFKLEDAAKDIQALLSNKLTTYYNAYKKYVKHMEDLDATYKEIVKHNRQVNGFSRRKNFDDGLYRALLNRSQELGKQIAIYPKLAAAYPLLKEQHNVLVTLAIHIHAITKVKADYTVIKDMALGSLTDITPEAPRKLEPLHPKRKNPPGGSGSDSDNGTDSGSDMNTGTTAPGSNPHKKAK